MATFTLTPTRTETPVRAVSGEITGPACGPRPVTVTLTSEDQEVQQTLIATPEQAAPFELALPTPSSTPVTLTVFAPGPECEATEDPRVRYAKVGNLHTY